MEYFNFYGGGGQQLPVFSNSPIWMLGHCYECEKNNNNSVTSSIPTSTSFSFRSFIEGFSSLLWFTYRRDFASLMGITGNTQFTSDVGWGCMLRSGQMILAQALLRANSTPSISNKGGDKQEVVRWFADSPSKEAPFSIHTIARAGEQFGKAVGEWFGPSTIANVLRELVATHTLSNLSVYVSDDGAIYVDTVTKIATAEGSWKPVLIIVPLRLGLETMNEIYYPSILDTFRFPQSLGIIGGRPRASLYFVAAQDEYVFYLDPHVCQPTVNADLTNETYHCGIPKRAHVSEIDPSLALAFCCCTKEQFDDFCTRETKHKESPLYTISTTAPNYKETSNFSMDDDEEDIEMDMDMVIL